MLPQPWLDRSFAHPARLLQLNQPVVRFPVLEKQPPVAIRQEKNACGRNRRRLVSIQKRMILR
jgi:hypothetical protein